MIPRPSRSRNLAALYRMTGRLVSSGIPPLQCATVLEQSGHGPGAREAATALATAFASGGLPSQALASAGAVPRHHVAVVSSGESIGRLDSSFDVLASWCEEQARIHAMTIRLLLEPAAIWLVVALIMPLGTLIRSGAGAYLARAVPVLLLPLIVGSLLKGRHAAGRGIPGLREPLRLLAVARFSRTLALLNAAGIALPRSLRDAGESAADPEIGRAAQRAATAVERGGTLTDALRKAGVLRPVEMSLVADGEITGRIDVAFQRAAELLEHEGFGMLRFRIRVAGGTLFAVAVIITFLSMAGAIVKPLQDLGG